MLKLLYKHWIIMYKDNIMNAHRRTQGKARKWKEAMKLDEAKAKEAEAKATKANAGSHLFLPCSPSRASTEGRVRSCSRPGLGTRTRWTASILNKEREKERWELAFINVRLYCVSFITSQSLLQSNGSAFPGSLSRIKHHIYPFLISPALLTRPDHQYQYLICFHT